ncbi:glycosyltransferase family 39 protein [Actinomadura sp. NPDC047616]|uniref:glycosyltransferase family 39 protein n=1 Tax=Actinomadura sp. NPDC047616 TaxID=3155914 RepID=UPI0034090F08
MPRRVLSVRAIGRAVGGFRGAGALTVTIPVALSFAVGLWALARPALWRDEAVTIGVARRSPWDALRLLSDIDAVHGLYYLVMHPVVAVFGAGETAVRLPSVLGAAAAAGLTAWLGMRLADARTGLVAGLLVAVSPAMSRYAQEARQYTWVTALAVAATLLLVRALERRGDDGGRREWAAYGAVVALMGWLHMFALLLVLPHAVAARRDLRRWAVAAGGALAAVLPLALLSVTQRAQVNWITRPGRDDLWYLLDMLAGTHWLILPTLALVVVALWRPSTRPGEGAGDDTRWGLLAWLVVPPVALLVASLVVPTYLFRYVLFCFPALALLVALGLRRLPAWAAAAVLAVLVVALVPAHRQVREPDARADDLRTLSTIIRTGKRPGDALLFHQQYYRRAMSAYADAYAGLRDIALGRTGTRSGTIDGEEVPSAELARRLADVERLWYVHRNAKAPDAPDRAKERLVRRSGAFRKVKRWRFKGGTVTLYENLRPGTVPGDGDGGAQSAAAVPKALSPAGGGRSAARPARPAPA